MKWCYNETTELFIFQHNKFDRFEPELTLYRADSRFAPSQGEMVLLCSDVSHWLGANLESSLIICVHEDIKKHLYILTSKVWCHLAKEWKARNVCVFYFYFSRPENLLKNSHWIPCLTASSWNGQLHWHQRWLQRQLSWKRNINHLPWNPTFLWRRPPLTLINHPALSQGSLRHCSHRLRSMCSAAI